MNTYGTDDNHNLVKRANEIAEDTLLRELQNAKVGKFLEITWADAADTDKVPWRHDIGSVKRRTGGVTSITITAGQQYHDQWTMAQLQSRRTHNTLPQDLTNPVGASAAASSSTNAASGNGAASGNTQQPGGDAAATAAPASRTSNNNTGTTNNVASAASTSLAAATAAAPSNRRPRGNGRATNSNPNVISAADLAADSIIELVLPHDAVIIKSIKVVQPPVQELPCSMRIAGNAFARDKIRFVIRTDAAIMHGAGASRTGPAAAAIIVSDLHTSRVERHAVYTIRGNTKTMSWIAWAAGCKRATQLGNNGVLIVTSNEFIFSSTTTPQRQGPTDEFCKKLFEESQRTFAIADRFVAHTRVEDCSAARDFAHGAIGAGKTIGDVSLFAQPPVEADDTQLPARATVRAPDIGEDLLRAVDFIQQCDDITRLRKFRTRSRVPHGCEAVWAQHVKCTLTKIRHATTREARSRGLLLFFCLPHLLLPTNASVTRIIQHLNNGRVFSIDGVDRSVTETTRPRQQQQKQSADSRDSVSKRVEALMHDCRVSSAVKFMQADAATAAARASTAATNEQHELRQQKTEVEKWRDDVEALRKKFPPRADADSFQPEPVQPIPAFSVSQVVNAINKMSRNAATGIDGWTRDLLKAAIDIDISIADDIGVIFAWVASSRSTEAQKDCNYFNELAMDVIRSARLVGIPKPEGGVRPIVISSFIAKLTGSLILRRAGVRPLRDQFAIGCRDGGTRIIHRTRSAYYEGKAVLRLDSSNAYNIAKRKRILDMLKTKLGAGDSTVTAEMIQYFITMYHPVSNMYSFGPDGCFAVVAAAEGVRQGDALSSFYFCLVMEKATDAIVAEFASRPEVGLTIECYMDDSTTCCNAAYIAEVTRCAIEKMQDNGFVINTDKSSVICKAGIDFGADAPRLIPVSAPTVEFKVLGGIVNDVYDKLSVVLRDRIARFFDSLDQLKVHPEMKHTIMHYCGFPKLIYFASTTPPDHSRCILDFFDRRCKESFARLIDADPTTIDPVLLHAVEGAGIPDYTTHAQALYVNSRTTAISAAKFCPRVELTNSTSLTSHVEAEHDSKWLRFIHPTMHQQLPPLHYSVALAMRVLKIPRHVNPPGRVRRCNCGEIGNNEREIIAHALRCKYMSHIEAGYRHTILKSALEGVARAYGISCSNEPGFYVYQEVRRTPGADNSDIYIAKQRPDCTFHLGTQAAIAIDVTIVTPGDDIGTAAARAAEEKRKTHTTAVNAAGHEFIPFAVETTGHMDSQCFVLFNRLANAVAPVHRYAIRRDLIGATSTAIAEYRATAIENACHVQQTLARHG